MKNISVLKKCNILFNNEHLILIRFFLLIDTEFKFKNYFENTYLIQKIIKYIYENPPNVVRYFQNRFQYPYRFSVSIENHPCNRTKEKTY